MQNCELAVLLPSSIFFVVVALDLHYSTRAFSSCTLHGTSGYSAWASRVVEHRLQLAWAQ